MRSPDFESTVEPLYSGHPREWHFGCYTEVAVVEGFHTGVKLNWDQGYWPLYSRWLLLRGGR